MFTGGAGVSSPQMARFPLSPTVRRPTGARDRAQVPEDRDLGRDSGMAETGAEPQGALPFSVSVGRSVRREWNRGSGLSTRCPDLVAWRVVRDSADGQAPS